VTDNDVYACVCVCVIDKCIPKACGSVTDNDVYVCVIDKCIPKAWECDGERDCGQDDDTDEGPQCGRCSLLSCTTLDPILHYCVIYCEIIFIR